VSVIAPSSTGRKKPRAQSGPAVRRSTGPMLRSGAGKQQSSNPGVKWDDHDSFPVEPKIKDDTAAARPPVFAAFRGRLTEGVRARPALPGLRTFQKSTNLDPELIWAGEAARSDGGRMIA